MDFLEPILAIAEKLYVLCGEVKANKKRWRRLASRVRALEEIVRTVKARGLGKKPAVVQQGLGELKHTLETAQEVVKKYTSANLLRRVLKVSDLAEEFEMLNDRLNDNFQLLSLGLQIEHGEELRSVFSAARCREEDKADREMDHEELMKLLQSQAEKMDNMQEGVDSVKDEVQDIKKILNSQAKKSSLMKSRLPVLDTREIKMDELEFDDPKKPLMTSPSHELYKGQYNKFSVAIKRYLVTANTTPQEVRRIFKKEVETMKRYESPNILRMFGICVQEEEGSSPNYFIVMEFCEKGNLREVLSEEKYKLSWRKRAHMALDAAQGLYRLHQSEEKFKVHGCISSTKFLVDAGFRVKLGCFELARTETSLKRNKTGGNSSVLYCSPQQLQSIHYSYNKACEIYSFGIVLWEIATRQIPFKGLSDKEIFKKVCEEKFMEPLPEDCPKGLAQLIDECRSYDAFKRPTAGVLVDKLRMVMQELDED